MAWQEVNFDGLVGPTHNYAGLSYGNLAATNNQGNVANPKAGALEGLEKMRFVGSLGLTQGVLPPVDRPRLDALHDLGFRGSDEQMLAEAWSSSPQLVANIMSAASMWTANAATVSPAPDTADGRTHFTPANLASMYHRSLEWPTTSRVLQSIFSDPARFHHHAALPGGVHMGDEGAANHNRFCAQYGDPGVALYVYGRKAFGGGKDLKFPGRQTLEASEAIARQHGTGAEKTLFVRQNPEAINAGAFHNDVVAVSNQTVFFYHEKAFEDPASLCQHIQEAMGDTAMTFIEVPECEVPLSDAVQSYLFNSQLISPKTGDGMTLIMPSEVAETPSTARYVETLLASGGPIKQAEYMDVRQSMRNGGGPACLRLRVVLSDDDITSIQPRAIVDDQLLDDLKRWVNRHYRDRIAVGDLADPSLMRESFAALDELTQLMNLGTVYDFQR